MSAAEQTALDVDEAVDEAPGTDLIPHPKTGEAIAVVQDTPTDVLAELRDAIVEHERAVIGGWKRLVDDELRRRLDYEGRRSAEVGTWKLTVPGPTKTEWDAAGAYRALRGLVRAGLISKDRADEAVERVVDYKARHGSLSQLLKHADERVRDAIAACRSDVPVDNRRVSVTRRAA